MVPTRPPVEGAYPTLPPFNRTSVSKDEDTRLNKTRRKQVQHQAASAKRWKYMATLLLTGACTSLPPATYADTATPAAQVAAMAGELETAQPEQLGVDSRPLLHLSRWLREQQLDIRSLLVLKDGKLIFERYTDDLSRDHNYELYSITKTITSLLAGMLIQEGRLSLDDNIYDVLSKFRPDLKEQLQDKRDITLRHLLSMSSGLHYDFNPENDPIYYGSPDRLKLVAGTTPKVAPGSEFEYTDVNPVFVAAMVSAAAGMPIADYAADKLFKPLGMHNYEWDRADDQGLASAGWGLRLRPIDLAKVGQLIMDNGQWQGRQLVPESWIKQMSTPVAARDFGYYLWLQHIVDTEKDMDMMGFKGQFATILPDSRTVVVMTSMLPIEGGLRHSKNVRVFRDIVNDYVVPAIHGKPDLAGAEQARQALQQELTLSASSQGKPGVFVDPTDAPRH